MQQPDKKQHAFIVPVQSLTCVEICEIFYDKVMSFRECNLATSGGGAM
jgi:hypothetical protein